jgi:diguanylate cyclase (GGDEF)-like protein
MIDVDHFKRFNDAYGHPAGDALLKSIAALMQSHFREGDVICRYGGEEFAIIAPGADLDLIRARADALRVAARELRANFEGHELGDISLSFGIACSPGRGGPTGHELIVQADQALYNAKRDGRDRVEVALGQITAARTT